LASLLVASKYCEDVHPWNADFETCLRKVAGLSCTKRELYRLESLFLGKLQWRMFVPAETYAAYWLTFIEGLGSVDDTTMRNGPLRDCIHADTPTDKIVDDAPPLTTFARAKSVPESGSKTPSTRSSTPTHRRTSSVQALPWSEQELVSAWQKSTLGDLGSDACGATMRAVLDVWKLDKKNPYIGALRHAPRSLGPSVHIPQSDSLLWSCELTAKTTRNFGHHETQQDHRGPGRCRTITTTISKAISFPGFPIDMYITAEDLQEKAPLVIDTECRVASPHGRQVGDRLKRGRWQRRSGYPSGRRLRQRRSNPSSPVGRLCNALALHRDRVSFTLTNSSN